MNPRNANIPSESLAAQRRALQHKLQQQREQIAQRIELLRKSDTTFPRSMTMRILLRRPALVAGLLAELTALVMGARVLKILTAALFVSRFLLTARAHRAAPALLPPPLPDQSSEPRPATPTASL